MQIGLRLPHSADLTIYATRLNGARLIGTDGNSPMLGEVDFSDPVAVANARTALLRMAVWDDFVRDAFQPERHPEARQAIADTILCLKAAVWKEYRNVNPIDGLAAKDLHAAQVRLFSLLSPEGLEALTASYEVAAEGIRYTPDSCHAEVNGLLRMVVAGQVISGLRELGPAANLVADTLDKHALAWREAEPARVEAENLVAASKRAKQAGMLSHAAAAIQKSAEAWEVADQSKVAMANALHRAAWQWAKLGELAAAARLGDQAASLFENAGETERAAKAYENAASWWDEADQNAAATRASTKAATAWEEARVYQDAALNWEAAGSPVRAAHAWKQALQDAGTGTPAADDVIENGALLFNSGMEYEQTLFE